MIPDTPAIHPLKQSTARDNSDNLQAQKQGRAWKSRHGLDSISGVFAYRKLFAKSSDVALATTLVFWKVEALPFSSRMRS